MRWAPKLRTVRRSHPPSRLRGRREDWLGRDAALRPKGRCRDRPAERGSCRDHPCPLPRQLTRHGSGRAPPTSRSRSRNLRREPVSVRPTSARYRVQPPQCGPRPEQTPGWQCLMQSHVVQELQTGRHGVLAPQPRWHPDRAGGQAWVSFPATKRAATRATPASGIPIQAGRFAAS